ncbi:MAG: peptidase [Cyanobacteriota bacterium]|jgi:predicted Zn-dependent protease|nr:peptidase [Cyanobacteriota bacterium]
MPAWALGLLAVVLVAPPAIPSAALAGCPSVRSREPLGPIPSVAAAPVVPSSAGPQDSPGYAAALRPSPLGWLHRHHWCVWVEPASGEGAGLERARQWQKAVEAALAEWGAVVRIERVTEPEAAQVVVRRRRPPLRRDGSGHWRASHGRAELELQRVWREGAPSAEIEALVSVQLAADQRPAAMQATALHELGHAFGLWGHSDDPGDGMAAVPGPVPVLRLSERDRSTMAWLLAQPGLQTGASPFSLNTPSNSTELR